jgi:hypothetical protein
MTGSTSRMQLYEKPGTPVTGPHLNAGHELERFPIKKQPNTAGSRRPQKCGTTDQRSHGLKGKDKRQWAS